MRAELIISFVPKDAFLIYGLINKEWFGMWKLLKYPTHTRVKYIVENLEIAKWFDSCVTLPERDYVIAYSSLEVAKFIYYKNHGPYELPETHFCKNTTCIWKLITTYYALIHRNRLDILGWACSKYEVNIHMAIYAARCGKLRALKVLYRSYFCRFPAATLIRYARTPEIYIWVKNTVMWRMMSQFFIIFALIVIAMCVDDQ